MEHVSCALCGADEPRDLCRIREDRFLKALGIVPPVSIKVMCGRCGHIYANPQLEEAELTRLYRDVYRSPALGYRDERPSAEYLYWKERKAARDYRWLREHLTPAARQASVLEIGCAEGLLLGMLARDGWQVLGVEATPSYAAHARRALGVEVIESLFEHAPLDGRQFDLVMALAVLEHIKHPIEFLRRIRGLLKRDGHLLVAVPDARELGSHPEEALSSPHLSVFTAETLTRMFRSVGLAPVCVEHSSERLVGLAGRADAASVGIPSVLPPDLRGLKSSIWRMRARARARSRIAHASQAVKRGLQAALGQEAGSAVWRELRRWTGRQGS